MPNVTVIKQNENRENTSRRLSPTRRKVAAYARVSTEKEDQTSSYESQVDYYTRLIQTNDDWEFAGIYADEGVTGTSTRGRAGFQSMIDDALSGKIDLIVTKSVSRFARNTVDSLTTIRLLKDHGTEVFFEKENIRTFDGTGELLITIMSSLAQEESRSISENVKWGMQEKMRQGQAWVPYKVFLGYDRGKDGVMTVNREQAKTVRRIFGYYLQGRTPYRIARLLEDEGIPFSEGKPHWYPSTVNSILKNEKYKGDALRQKTYTSDYLSKKTLQNRGEYPQYYIHGHHEAIVSPSLFDRVQKEIARRKSEKAPHEGGFPFSGRIVCGECGARFTPVIREAGTPRERRGWRCPRNRANAKLRCSSREVSEETLETAYLSALNQYLGDGKEVFSAIREKFGQILPAAAVQYGGGTEPNGRDAVFRFLDELEKRRKAVPNFGEAIWYNLAASVTVRENGLFSIHFKDGSIINVCTESVDPF